MTLLVGHWADGSPPCSPILGHVNDQAERRLGAAELRAVRFGRRAQIMLLWRAAAGDHLASLSRRHLGGAG